MDFGGSEEIEMQLMNKITAEREQNRREQHQNRLHNAGLRQTLQNEVQI